MKRFAVALILLSVSSLLNAQALNVVFQLNELEKANLAVNSINALLKEEPQANIVLVVHGPAILRLANNDGLRWELGALIEKGVTINACNNAVLKNGLDPSLLFKGIVLLPEGGVKRILELQQQGYLYIKI